MKSISLRLGIVFALVGSIVGLMPLSAQDAIQKSSVRSGGVDVPFTAIVETIEFRQVTPEEQKVVLERIGVRTGDMLTIDARHRIGRELGKAGKGMTFSYTAGSRPGTARLVISSDC